MKTNQEILDEFGKEIIKNVFDESLRFVNNNLSDLKETKEFSNLFGGMKNLEFLEFKKYTIEILKADIFNFLKIFEENENFKIIYEIGNQKINLVEISEMLKAEPIIENGWIERFSKELKNENK